MFTELFWINGPWPGQLAVSARPRGGDWLEDEVKAWRQAGVETVVSLLTPQEAADLSLEQEGELCAANGIEYYSFPIEDRSVPISDAETARLLSALDKELSQGRNMTIHCRQGIGRSGLIATSLLIEKGVSPDEAVKRVSNSRHVPVPETPEQRAWINSFAATFDQRR